MQDATIENVYTASKGSGILPYLKKVYSYRKMILILSKRDLKMQYAQTLLGVLWSAIQPITGLVVFTFFFVYVFKIDTGGIPYPLVALTGIIPWYYFTNVMANAGTSLVDNQDLIRRLYFPRLILPLSKALNALVDLGVAFLVYTLLAVYYGQIPGKALLLLPVVLLLLAVLSLTLGIWLSALTIRFRDLQRIIPYLVNLGIWFTPVFYPASLVPEEVQPFLYLNPMAGIIEGLRFSLLGTGTFSIAYAYPWVIVFIAFVAGLLYFRKTEKIVSDYI